MPGIFRAINRGAQGAAILALLLITPYCIQAQVVRTGYTAIISAGSGKCLNIDGASTASGAPAVQTHCGWAANELWTVKRSGGAFQIIVNSTSQCLSVLNNSISSGASVVQTPCSTAKGQLWSFSATGNTYQIISVNSNQCLYVYQASTADRVKTVQSPCTTSNSAKWIVWNDLVMPSTLVTLQANHSGQCLYSGSGASGTSVVQYPCSGSTSEQWSLVPYGNYLRVVAKNGGLCLSVSGASTSSGAKLAQQSCSTQTSGMWVFKPIGAGAHQLQSVSSGMCATVQSASTSSSAPVIQSACSTALNDFWSISAATLPSKWAAVVPLSVDPIAIANLPDGKILMWSADSQYTFLSDLGLAMSKTYTGIFDPGTNTSSKVLVSNTGHDMFCPGTANLPDGRILVNGGSSSPRTSIYDPDTSLWSGAANMKVPRGYQGDTLLSDGSVFTLGGSWSGGLGGKTGEVWTESGGWRLLSGVPEDPVLGTDPKGIYRNDNHLWLFAVANQRVFHAGPSVAMHWIDTAGAGSITSAGNRGSDAFSINGSAMMFDAGKILKAGGAPAYSDSDASASTYLIDISSGVKVSKVAPMTYRRGFANGVVLPNGQVVIVGGQTHPIPFTDSTAVLVPELWDPKTRVFKRMAPMKTPRTYHSTAILMTDGRVWVGGGGQCGQGCTANHFDTEILSPPYLFNPDGSSATRPRINKVASTASLGGMLPIATDSPVASFALVRLSSVTHTVNNDQRRIPLKILSTGGATAYTVQIPSDAGVVLPGYYMLFALNGYGVPSVAAIVLIG